jgi:ectoine hydroxylase-related dioxygenase (phytanoyl-CoA dioxygenase family)
LLRSGLVGQGLLPAAAVAIQAIAFDKTATTNWKVSWHQDLMFPFARKTSSPGYLLPSVKDGIHFAQPPASVLDELLAVRLHLDDCGPENGPLRVSPGTHRLGILPAAAIADHVRVHGQVECLAGDGEALLMRPLLLHASSQATRASHRRVLHIVYHSGAAIPEPWHQSV